MERQFVEGTWQNERTFSPAVCTTGGRIIWLAGHGATVDSMGNPIPHDFEAQTRQAFENLGMTLQRAGGSLQDIVTMTVFIIDSRHGTRFVEIRKEFYPVDFPASTLVTVTGFAKPEMMVEITPVAVVDA